MKMLISYRMIIGAIIRKVDAMSPGVSREARIVMATIEWRLLLLMNSGVTIPSTERIMTTTGSSKTTPKAIKMRVTNPRYSPTSIVGAKNCCWNPARKMRARGRTKKYAIATPRQNSTNPK